MNIRSATKRDINTLILLQQRDGFPHQYYLTEDRLEGLMKRGESFFVIFSPEHTPIGFASIDLEIRAQLHFLCVDKKYGKRGYGTALMQRLLCEAKKHGYSRACSYVESGSNKEKFLKKFKFDKVGFYKNRYGNGADASIWEVKL